MQYMGSKNKYSKFIVPILQKEINDNNIQYYIEPFVGGANIIDKINCCNRIGYDINYYLIELLKFLSNNCSDEINKALPETILEDEYKVVYQYFKNNVEYKYDDWYIGLVGFCASFGSKFFNSYARNSKQDITGKRVKSAINNLRKQEKLLKEIKFYNIDYKNIEFPKEQCLVYCDPPYLNTSSYKNISNNFNHNEYYDWLYKLNKLGHIVYCSEYSMPKEFKVAWEKKVTVNLGRNVNKKETEKLFKLQKI